MSRVGIGRRTSAALFAVAMMGGTAGCGGSGGESGEKGPSGPAPVSDARRMSESLTLLKGYRSLGLTG
ncbi:hypothetical protein [Streptomyces sp. NPDC053720]|uniref:hypothetical protein n=1 Tax=Streptomyces sp. NPDC053720 TaxID=3154855 RepID=UPI0034208A1A